MISEVSLPPPVNPGDRIGVAALSGKVDPLKLEAGLEALSAAGYEPVQASNLRARCGLFAGSDRERLAAFHELAADDSLNAIIFARGGSGVLRVLPGIDWRLLGRRPRAYVGYSDLTPFLMQVISRLRLTAFHGPMVAADFARGLSDLEMDSFTRAVGGQLPVELSLSSEMSSDNGSDPTAPSGAVRGPLLGGCLTMLAATLGTPFATELDDAILFLEDVGEPLYRFDRMLTHLRLSGSLANLKAVIVGHLDGEGGYPNAAASPEVLLDQLRREARGFPWPLAWGLAVGHDRPNLTLPLGLTACLDSAAGQLTIDPPVASR